MIDPMTLLTVTLVILALLILIPLLILYIKLTPPELTGYKGYFYKKSTSTEETIDNQKVTTTQEYQQGKTWWDWQQLLLIPLVLTIATIGFSWEQNLHSEQLAQDQQQEITLETYMDRMSDLLLNNNNTIKLHDSKRFDPIRKVARARTLTALSRLDSERKRSVVQFLYEADLITWHRWPTYAGYDFPIITLSNADLRGADLSNLFLANADLDGALLNNAQLSNTDLSISTFYRATLSGADLSGTYLSGSDLHQADLTAANLSGTHMQVYTANLPTKTQARDTNLSQADFHSANLTGAYLNGANLSDADLSGADVTGANFRSANLRGATMPDGSKHP